MAVADSDPLLLAEASRHAVTVAEASMAVAADSTAVVAAATVVAGIAKACLTTE